MNINSGIIILLFGVSIGIAGFSYWKIRQFKMDIKKREEDVSRRMYEMAILKELGDRIGYSLNVEKIIDIIIGSLGQLVDYSVVSSMMLEPKGVVFKAHLERSISHGFIDDVRQRMLTSLSALLNQTFTKESIEEVLSGAIVIDDLEDEVKSFFNIPLVIGGKAVGVLTVASIKEGLYKEEEMTVLYKIVRQASDAVTKLHNVIQTEQHKLNAMVESMGDGVLMTDIEYHVVVANPAAIKIAGMDPAKKDVTIFDFIDNLGKDFDIRSKLEESVKLGKIIKLDEITIRDGVYQVIILPVKNHVAVSEENKEVLGGAVIFHDISAEKAAEKMRKDFTSMMVHELRSPLDGLKKMAEVMKDPGIKQTKKDINEFDTMVYDGSSQMLELVNDLLDVAKLESGKFEINKGDTNIRELLENRIHFYDISAKDAGIVLQSSIDKKVPKTIFSDQTRISQVFNNLISNALKFTSKGGVVTLNIFKHVKGEGILTEAKDAGVEWHMSKVDKELDGLSDSLIVAVVDSGAGIADGDIGELFNKFKQLKSRSTSEAEQKGTGLGLAISKGIVEAHEGIIGASSVEDKGSTFYFTLPLSEKVKKESTSAEATADKEERHTEGQEEEKESVKKVIKKKKEVKKKNNIEENEDKVVENKK